MKLILLLALLGDYDQIGGALDYDQIGRSDREPTQAKKPAARALPVITVFSPSWCSGCRQMEREVYGNDQFEFRFVHDEENFPQWVQDRVASGQGWPALYWEARPKQWRVRHGWTSIEDFRKHWEDRRRDHETAATVGQSPTPIAEVRRILAMLRPQPHEVFVDYGCGDGRWLIEAARTYNCRAIGVEIDPLQVDLARKAVDAAGLVGRVQIIEGDVLTANVEAQVGVAYLYPGLLEKLKPKLLKLNRFATPYHSVAGVEMQQSGDAWFWQRPAPVTQQQPYASYGGQAYYGRVCDNPRCQMCNAIQRQLSRAWRQR